MWLHRTIQLPPATRGFHLITELVEKALPEISQVQIGLLNVFIQHTSASLTINENADPDVPRDLEAALNVVASEDFPYEHTVEGPDDMPAHVRTMLTGVSLQIPMIRGQLALGTWQGIYLIEHRARPHRRQIILQFAGSCS